VYLEKVYEEAKEDSARFPFLMALVRLAKNKKNSPYFSNFFQFIKKKNGIKFVDFYKNKKLLFNLF